MTKNVAPKFFSRKSELQENFSNSVFCFFLLLPAKQQKILGQMFVPFICQTVVVVVCPLFSRLFANPSAL